MKKTLSSGPVFQNAAKSPLGRITQAGYSHMQAGTKLMPMRILGSFAMVYTLDGIGQYHDATAFHQELRPGDLILVFPDHPHRYGASANGYWEEFWIVFEGPMFELWRKQEVIAPSRPIYHVEPVDYWRRRFEEVVSGPVPVDEKQSMAQLCKLQQSIADVLHRCRRHSAAEDDSAWLARACALLEIDLEKPMYFESAAERMSMSYESFRKRFVKLAGTSPGKYRMARIIDRACQFIHESRLSNRQIASALGFCDEFHFSRRFKHITGKSPSQYRGLWKG